jgi:hypothetical protein
MSCTLLTVIWGYLIAGRTRVRFTWSAGTKFSVLGAVVGIWMGALQARTITRRCESETDGLPAVATGGPWRLLLFVLQQNDVGAARTAHREKYFAIRRPCRGTQYTGREICKLLDRPIGDRLAPQIRGSAS